MFLLPSQIDTVGLPQHVQQKAKYDGKATSSLCRTGLRSIHQIVESAGSHWLQGLKRNHCRRCRDFVCPCTDSVVVCRDENGRISDC